MYHLDRVLSWNILFPLKQISSLSGSGQGSHKRQMRKSLIYIWYPNTHIGDFSSREEFAPLFLYEKPLWKGRQKLQDQNIPPWICHLDLISAFCVKQVEWLGQDFHNDWINWYDKIKLSQIFPISQYKHYCNWTDKCDKVVIQFFWSWFAKAIKVWHCAWKNMKVSQ